MRAVQRAEIVDYVTYNEQRAQLATPRWRPSGCAGWWSPTA
ncbi:hypothetical protein OV079_32885 [Nannocystis pusilla]|uniref:Uncharacterized protein n=1 Tax=Nannocystis pusilla TaxID=889268 RepID=A0A9X3EU94_9BACT|nr:hypothetical protein [Nannocystis pusilla]MCY1010282.1 hypothetical protein [Nannocystis pusilla]